MKYSKLLTLFFAILVPPQGNADDLSGTWKFEKAQDYYGQPETVVPKYPTVQFLNGQTVLPVECASSIEEIPFIYSSTFQMLLKSGINQSKLNIF